MFLGRRRILLVHTRTTRRGAWDAAPGIRASSSASSRRRTMLNCLALVGFGRRRLTPIRASLPRPSTSIRVSQVHDRPVAARRGRFDLVPFSTFSSLATFTPCSPRLAPRPPSGWSPRGAAPAYGSCGALGRDQPPQGVYLIEAPPGSAGRAGFEVQRTAYFNTLLFPAIAAVRLARPSNTVPVRASDFHAAPGSIERPLRLFGLEARFLEQRDPALRRTGSRGQGTGTRSRWPRTSTTVSGAGGREPDDGITCHRLRCRQMRRT